MIEIVEREYKHLFWRGTPHLTLDNQNHSRIKLRAAWSFDLDTVLPDI